MGKPSAPKAPKINYQTPDFDHERVRGIVDDAGDELSRVIGEFDQRGQGYLNS